MEILLKKKNIGLGANDLDFHPGPQLISRKSFLPSESVRDPGWSCLQRAEGALDLH